VHVPADRRNPYQRALGLALGRLGIRVRRLPFRWNVLRVARGMDVLHIHWTSALINNPWWKVAVGFPLLAGQFLWLRASGRRIIWTVHNLEGHECRRPVQNWLGSTLIGIFANVVIVHGKSALGQVARRFAIPPRKIAVIPHGNYLGQYPDSCSQAEARDAFNLPADRKVILFLGHLRPYKGVEDLVRAFASITDARAVLMIAGKPLDDDYQERLERLVAGNPRIRYFPGYVATARVQEFMQAADVVVFPYKEVLTSGAVLLAMSFGKACVAARLGCICDVLDDDGAFLYPIEVPGALEGALRNALGSMRRLEAMGKHNLVKAQQWSWNRIAAATAVAYAGGMPAFGWAPVADNEVIARVAGEE
jgi:beta-1,4-mannosyltransferase